MQARTTWPLLVVLLAGLSAPGAAPAPAAKKAFLERQAIYLRFEITETGTREFGTGTPNDALTDGAHRILRSVKFEVPLDMAVPGSVPMSSMPVSPVEMGEQDRFIGWMAVPPDDPAAEEQLASGKIDPARNPMFLPVEFSIDDVKQFRHRDAPTDGWGTETRTFKGRGVAYIARSGMLMCDLKKMACDINNVLLDYNEGTDLVTVTASSDVPGFVAKRETTSPGLMIPKIPAGLAGRLAGFTITLPEPSTLTFEGPSSESGSTVAVKVTLSAKPAPKTAPVSR